MMRFSSMSQTLGLFPLRRIKSIVMIITLASAIVITGCGTLLPDKYTLDESPPFLTEELALAKALEFVSHNVSDQSKWEPVDRHNPSLAPSPDGKPEIFLIRYNAKAGEIWLRRGRRKRFIQVELTGHQLICTRITRH